MCQFDSPTMLHLRKSALLAHWIPGLGILVRHHGRDVIRVAPHRAHPSVPAYPLEFDPCAFRQFVVSFADDETWPPHPLDPADGIDVRLFTVGPTEVGLNGVVRAAIDSDVAVFGFACALDLATAQRVARERDDRACALRDRVHLDHDPDLAITLVHGTYQLASPADERRVHDHVADLGIACAAEEVTHFLAGAG